MVVLGTGNGSVIVASPRNAFDLLAEFKLSGRQEAFEEIVRRYAAMVFGVCLKTTRNPHDAEDATQAVFLNLAVHCKTSDQPITYVGPWLQKVARRVSLDIRRSKKRRQAREETHAATNGNGNGNGHVDGGQDGVDVEELKVVLNEELHQLPAKYRLPMILHYYGGLSRDEMAKELGCKPSTLGVRIHRGRQMLAQRLTERGASPGHLSLGLAISLSVRSAVGDGIIAATSKAAAELMAGNELGTMVSSHVLAFSHSAAGVAMIAKLKSAAAIIVVALLTLAAAAGAVAKVVPLDELKRQWPLKLQGIFRIPRLQSPFRAPVADANGHYRPDAMAMTAQSLATDAAVQTVMWLGETPAGRDAQRVRPGGTPNRSRRGFGATGRVVTQLVSTFIGSNVAAATRGDEPSNPAPEAPSRAPTLAASVPQSLPASLPPHRDHRNPSIGGPGAVSGSFAGGVARASGAVTLGRDPMLSPLVPPPRTNGSVPGGAAAPLPVAREPVLSRGPSMVIGGAPGSRGTVTIDRGALAIDNQVVGGQGVGELTHRGGNNVARAVRIGADAGGKGVYNLNDDRLLIKGADPYATLSASAGGPQLNGIEVGGDGAGELNIGDGLGGGSVSDEYGPLGGSLVVRGGEAGSGVLRGTGLIDLHGFFNQNGRAVADGYGRDRTLEFRGFKYVGNTFDNPTHGGTNGWFARDHGKLVLPNLRVRAGTHAYTWGDDPTDPTIDLVNSARLTIHDAVKDGPVRVSLLSKDRNDVPALPQGHTFIGIWQFEDGGLAHGAVDLLVRYDDGLAEELKLDENVLKLWRYHDGQWIRINDSTFTRDTELNLIGGTAGALEYFAVSAPEPSAVAVLLLGGGAALLRRRRRAT